MGRWFGRQLMVTPRTTYGVIEDSLWVQNVNLWPNAQLASNRTSFRLGTSARPATVDAFVAATVSHHERSAGRTQRRIAHLIRVVQELGDAGRGLVWRPANFPASSRSCDKQRQLLSGQEAQLHPAEEVVHDGFGIAHLLVAGPARRFEPGMRQLVTQHLEGHSVLETDRHHRAETLHETCDRGAGLGHPNENLARLSIGIKAHGQVAVVSRDGEVMVYGRAFVLQSMTIRCRRT
jgi:hypothetical protein